MCAHLLIVEDDETIAEFLVDNLRQDGHALLVEYLDHFDITRDRSPGEQQRVRGHSGDDSPLAVSRGAPRRLGDPKRR